MPFVTKRDDVVENLKTFEGYLRSKKKEEKEWAVKMVLSAETVIIYKVNGENHFAPSVFCAHIKNSIKAFEADDTEPKEINKVLTKIIGNPFYNEKTDEKHIEYTDQFGKVKPNPEREFWRVKDERGKNLNLKF